MQKQHRHIRYFLLAVLSALSLSVMAQQEPVYTQDIFSIQTVNPAYTGIRGQASITALARQQWLGLTGAPGTQTLIFQSSTKDEKVGYGLTLTNDKIGLEKRISVYGDYSYKLALTEETSLRLGLKLGFTNYSNNLFEYTIYDPNYDIDPAFQDRIEQRFMPNFGIGAFLYGENYYVGLSIPRIIQNELKNRSNGYVSYAQIRHLFLKAGYVFDVADGIKFKPVFNTTVVIGAPVYMGFGANILFKDKVWLGALYRIGDSFGLLGQWQLNEKLNAGYAIDFSSSDLSRYHSGTHEIVITYQFNYKSKKRKSIPYF